ncbi:DUF3828 domain-containing protein [Kosakonia pseudosacchari]|uniref:DUF3828 domain-containing protein n=1 Tax=Kosakonia pseudosacchari TaxID=1646340 RepID=UPI000A398930|nr:DUF3828 domain-containing protein [Kosakonia pseudosacchari]
MKIISFFTAMIFIASVGVASAANLSCVSPEKTTSDFYHWYLHELNQNKYPLTSTAVNDKQKLNKWVSPRLLRELEKSLSENELDAEYFTDAQDIFEDWVNNISVQKVKKTAEHYANVELILGITNIKKKYDVSLNVIHGCWKIDHVASSK